MLCSDLLCTMLGFETARVSFVSVRLGHDKRARLCIPLVLRMARSLSCALGGGSGKDIAGLSLRQDAQRWSLALTLREWRRMVRRDSGIEERHCHCAWAPGWMGGCSEEAGEVAGEVDML